VPTAVPGASSPSSVPIARDQHASAGRAVVPPMKDERLTRLVLLLVILAVFLLVPLRIIAYGYTPPDDALRHTAFSVVNRTWGDVMLLDPRLPAWMDLHPGWHGFLRAMHDVTGWDQGALVTLSILLASWTFVFAGTIASGNPPAWFLACSAMAVLEPALLLKLTLGRPLFASMTAIMVLLFIWTRRQPLRPAVEAVVTGLVLTVSLLLHSSAWYLWLITVPPLVACRRWRTLAMLGACFGTALAVTTAVNGWYNVIVLPIEQLRLALFQAGTLTPDLATELQPSGAPVFGILCVTLVLLARRSGVRSLTDQLMQVDFLLMVTAWLMGLHVARFWVEWGLPAMAVCFTRQLGEGLGISFEGLRRRAGAVLLFGAAAATYYLSLTADLGGRYTNVLKNPLLFAPRDEIATDMPEPGGVLYSIDMGAFYSLFHRLPDARFRYATAYEPGLMPADDQAVRRNIQILNLTADYKPWFDKMRPADRVLLRGAVAPQWPGMSFTPFYGAWIGRKLAP